MELIQKREDELEKSSQTLVSVVDRLYRETSRLREETNRLREIISPHNYGIKELEEEIDHQHVLKDEIRKRLHTLEIRQARVGIDAPPEVEIEITDTRKRISEIEAKLKILEFDLAQLSSSDENSDNN